LGLSGIAKVAAGEDHVLALTSDGIVAAWGGNESGQTDIPSNLGKATAIAAGWNYSVALVGGSASPGFQLSGPTWKDGTFSVSAPTQAGKSYALEYKNSFSDTGWTPLPPVTGNGGLVTLTDPSAQGAARFYRVVQQ
jgi:Regulator of chromosome condensation (RCC1) repeat